MVPTPLPIWCPGPGWLPADSLWAGSVWVGTDVSADCWANAQDISIRARKKPPSATPEPSLDSSMQDGTHPFPRRFQGGGARQVLGWRNPELEFMDRAATNVELLLAG